jgi:hypothetical protein
VRCNRFAAALIVALVTFACRAQAQFPAPPAPSPPAPAPAPSFADIVAGDQPTDVMPLQTPVGGPMCNPGAAPPGPRVVTGPLGTITASIFGQPDPDTWRPLPIWTFFTEGWDEAWVPSPSGSGGAPRQGWINAADGNLYRLWFFTFAQAFHQGNKSNAYLGAYTIFLPFSRRMDLIINVPFVVTNNASSGLPIINPTRMTTPTSRSQTTFGDMSFTPRFLLHETKDFSLTSETAVLVRTGRQPLEGKPPWSRTSASGTISRAAG